MLRVLREIALEGHDGVTFRVGGSIHCLPDQLFQGPSIPEALLRVGNPERKAPPVPLEDFPGIVGGCIVQDQDFVIPPELAHDVPDFPKEDTDGALFIVNRNGYIDHVYRFRCWNPTTTLSNYTPGSPCVLQLRHTLTENLNTRQA